MLYTFETPTGVAITRRTTRLDYAEGLDFLVDALDRTRGAYFSSGVEYPDRYTRWDFGFTDPPLEFVANERRVTMRALNPRGEVLLAILRPVLAAAPATTVVSESPRALELEVTPAAGRFPEEERSHQPSALTPLRRLMAEFAGIEDAFLGFYGAFGYDLIFQFEPMTLRLPRGEARRDFHLYLPDRIYVLDRRLEAAFCHDFTFARGEATTKGASHRPFDAITLPGKAAATAGVTADQSAEDYAAKVELARERMIAGDVFEVVLSREFRAAYPKPPSALFNSFRETNPSPYEFLIQLGDEAIVGASPEMFVRVEGDRVESCPIAGTVRRSGDPMEDADRVRELLNSAKDEAELTMCTDVDRNDKARICEPGSVRLIGRRLIERYAGLFHTVDHVEGRLRPGFDGIDAFLSHMWAVTLTGAPKRKAVEIIEALETQPRRWYGAAVGGIGFAGGVNTGITIRTAVLKEGVAFYRAGASLVYDSVGVDEARETEVKATAFFRALGLSKPAAATPAAATTAKPGRARPRVVMIDHEDSFVHVLADYLRQTGAEVATYRWGLPVDEITANRPDLVVLSPGPGRPEEFGLPALVRALAAECVPQFGVCLGLQGIAEAFGGTLALLEEPRHGKTWQVEHDGTGLFEGLPAPFEVGAYHSIHAPAGDLPPELEITGRTAAGIVMALRHATLPIAAVQFHPESIMTMRGQAGLRLVGNAVRLLAGQGRAQGARAAAPAA